MKALEPLRSELQGLAGEVAALREELRGREAALDRRVSALEREIRGLREELGERLGPVEESLSDFARHEEATARLLLDLLS